MFFLLPNTTSILRPFDHYHNFQYIWLFFWKKYCWQSLVKGNGNHNKKFLRSLWFPKRLYIDCGTKKLNPNLIGWHFFSQHEKYPTVQDFWRWSCSYWNVEWRRNFKWTDVVNKKKNFSLPVLKVPTNWWIAPVIFNHNQTWMKMCSGKFTAWNY